MWLVAALTFADARRCVLERVRSASAPPSVETVTLAEASGRILAKPVSADRDYPPRPRSMRDGFALRAADLPGTLHIIGEIRAGQASSLEVAPGQAVEIMTGASVPVGADAVVMIEHVAVEGATVRVEKRLEPGSNINAQGCDALAGSEILAAGRRIGSAEAALLASAGCEDVDVYRRARVAIVATGDEIIELGETPLPHQIRNSNSWSLAHQVLRTGCEADILPIAPDLVDETRELLRDGLQSDLLLISGGVSAGKYDVVEIALKQLGAELFFDRVLIQPGQPCVFGRAQGTFFFGLPGNPASTMVCFEVLARAALELIGGMDEPALPLTLARLAVPFRHKAGLTRFLPATLHGDGTLTPVAWSGSGDIPAMARSNCFLVAAPDQAEYEAGDLIQVLLR